MHKFLLFTGAALIAGAAPFCARADDSLPVQGAFSSVINTSQQRTALVISPADNTTVVAMSDKPEELKTGVKTGSGLRTHSESGDIMVDSEVETEAEADAHSEEIRAESDADFETFQGEASDRIQDMDRDTDTGVQATANTKIDMR